VLRRSIALVALVAGVAHADGHDRVVAIAPLTTLDAEDTSAATRKLTGQLEAAVGALGGAKVISAAQVADAIKKARKSQLKACEGDPGCLSELGKLVGAEIVIAGQIGGLGDSRIIYLSAIDVAGGKELRSTTLSVGTKDADPGGAGGAVIRLLEPEKYRGTLKLALDVTGATIYVNGTKVAPSPAGELSLPVGTQAVRVTHPQYRDFVKFIDVPFNRTTDIAVGMTQYPIIQNEIRGNPTNRDRVVYVDPPVWRRWYVVGPAAVGLAILTGILVGNLVHDVPSAPCKRVGGQDC